MTYGTTVSLYYCPACGYEDTPLDADQFEHDHSSGDVYCTRNTCGASVRYAGERPARWASVAAYEQGRAYGGPEEGGWYYTTGDLIPETVRAFDAGDFAQMAVYKEMIGRRYAPSISASECGIAINVYPERLPPAGFPETRPYYC